MNWRALSLALAASATLSTAAAANALDARFSCSVTSESSGERIILADSGEIKLDNDRISAFRWESALFRSSHGFDCSIDESDGLVLENAPDAVDAWRVTLADAQAARLKRGYDFERGMQCDIRLVREGRRLSITPDCPALCGSRSNFSALSIDLDNGNCRYGQ